MQPVSQQQLVSEMSPNNSQNCVPPSQQQQQQQPSLNLNGHLDYGQQQQDDQNARQSNNNNNNGATNNNNNTLTLLPLTGMIPPNNPVDLSNSTSRHPGMDERNRHYPPNHHEQQQQQQHYKHLQPIGPILHNMGK